MQISKKATCSEACQLIALVIARLVLEKPSAVIILATGVTMELVYVELARLHREWGLDFSRVVTFNLDEYLGLGPEHPKSFRFFMESRLFRHINIRPENTHVPDGLAKDPFAFCQEYEEMIEKAGGVDLVLVGIGRNGHVAFVEPDEALSSRTALKMLSESTQEANFGTAEGVPRYALTMGIGTIMAGRQIVLLATGEKKAEAIAKAVEGPITTEVPASLLQLHHNVTVVVDEAAGSQLSRRYPSQLPLEQSLPDYPDGLMVI